MATGREGIYEVVHERVAVRDAPTITGQALAVLQKGTQISGTPFEVNGEPWLRLSPYTTLPSQHTLDTGDDDSIWILIDGAAAKLNVGQLLRRIADEDHEAEEPYAFTKMQIRIRLLSGEAHLVSVDCFADQQDLRLAVETALGVPRREQRFIYGEAELTDSALQEILNDAENTAELTLIRRPPMQARWLARVRKDWQCLKHATAEIKADREIILSAVSQHGAALVLAAEELREDREVVLAAVKSDWRALDFATLELKRDRDVVLAAVRQSWKALQWAASNAMEDAEVVYLAVRQQPDVLKDANAKMRSERRIVLAAVKHRGRLLELADEALRADRRLVLAAVEQDGSALEFAAAEVRADKAVVLAAVKQQWCALEHAGEELRGDFDVALAAVRQSPEALEFVPSLRSDAAFLLAAARYHPSVLRCALAEALRASGELSLALAATQQRADVLKDAAEDLTSDRNVVLAAVSWDGLLLEFAAEALRKDKELVMAAVCQAGCALQFAATIRQHDLQVAAAAVRGSWRALAHVPAELRAKREVLLAAVAQSLDALKLLTRRETEEFWRDRAVWGDSDVVVDLVAQDGMLLKHASQEVRKDHGVVMAAVKQNWQAIRHAGTEPRTDRGIVRAVVTQDAQAFRHVAAQFWSDKDIMLSAVRAHGSALQFASTRLRSDAEVVTAAVRQDRDAIKYAAGEHIDVQAILAAAARCDDEGSAPEPSAPAPPRRRAPDREAEEEDATPEGEPSAVRTDDVASTGPELVRVRPGEDALLQGVRYQSALESLEEILNYDPNAAEGQAEPAAGARGPAEGGASAPAPRRDLGSVRMKDPEGEEGTYTGRLDARGKADGLGELLYDDGERFVGSFACGAMLQGTLYSKTTSRPRDTMRNGKWTPSLDKDLVCMYPVQRASQQAACLTAAHPVARALGNAQEVRVGASALEAKA